MLGQEPTKLGGWLDRDEAREQDPRDRRRVRPGGRPGRAGRGPRRRRPAAGRDPQGALPRRAHPDPRRADRRARAAGGRRAVRHPARAEGAGPDGHLHLPQARRGARGRRRDHRHPARHHGRHRAARAGHRAPARRADGRQRAALAGDPRVDRHRRPRAQRSRTCRWSRTGAPLLADISFTIHGGEVLGIAGVEGNGQAELVETIMGMRTVDRRPGASTWAQDITRWPTRERREAGIGYIPEDRTGTACCWRRRCGRTGCSATRPSRRTHEVR